VLLIDCCQLVWTDRPDLLQSFFLSLFFLSVTETIKTFKSSWSAGFDREKRLFHYFFSDRFVVQQWQSDAGIWLILIRLTHVVIITISLDNKINGKREWKV
jgi:hypothetical protein